MHLPEQTHPWPTWQVPTMRCSAWWSRGWRPFTVAPLPVAPTGKQYPYINPKAFSSGSERAIGWEFGLSQGYPTTGARQTPSELMYRHRHLSTLLSFWLISISKIGVFFFPSPGKSVHCIHSFPLWCAYRHCLWYKLCKMSWAVLAADGTALFFLCTNPAAPIWHQHNHCN